MTPEDWWWMALCLTLALTSYTVGEASAHIYDSRLAALPWDVLCGILVIISGIIAIKLW